MIVFHEEGRNDLNHIYIQLPEQIALNHKYDQVVVLDATYKVKMLAMTLFTLLVVERVVASNKILYHCCHRWCYWDCMGIKKEIQQKKRKFNMSNLQFFTS